MFMFEIEEPKVKTTNSNALKESQSFKKAVKAVKQIRPKDLTLQTINTIAHKYNTETRFLKPIFDGFLLENAKRDLNIIKKTKSSYNIVILDEACEKYGFTLNSVMDRLENQK